MDLTKRSMSDQSIPLLMYVMVVAEEMGKGQYDALAIYKPVKK